MLSVVVLCYRSGGEGARLARSVQVQATLTASGVADYQLVLVGNYLEGDDDPTPDVVRALAAADPRIVCSGRSPGGARWAGTCGPGMALATGEVIAVIDGDGQVKAGDLVRLYRALLDGGFDLALSRRVRRADGLARRALSAGYNLAFRLLFPGTGAHDVNAKPKLLRRQAFERLRLTADDWFIDAELMIQARRLGFRICELPTDYHGIRGRISFVSLRAVVDILRNLLL